MLFVLCCLCQCEWWDFNPDEFNEKISESEDIPLFIFAFSARCPHCRGLPPRFEAFGKQLDLGAPVVLTNLNCTAHQQACGEIGVMTVPSWFLIDNPRNRIMVQIPRNEDAWRDWLSKRLKVTGPPTADGLSNRQRERILGLNNKGESVFVLVSKNDKSAAETAFENKKKEFGNNKSRFIITRGEEEGITVYLSENCSCKGDLSDIDGFIEANPFGSFSKYNYTMWKSITNKRPTATLFVQSRPNAEERAILSVLAQKLCCKYAVGWAPIGRSFKIMAEIIRGDQSKAFVAAKNGDCVYLLRNEITEASVQKFADDVLAKNLKCEKITSSPPIKQNSSMKLYVLGAMSIVAVVGLVAFIRKEIIRRSQAKDE